MIFVNIFSCCMSTLLLLYQKSFGNNERADREENDDRNRSVAQGPSFPVWSAKIGSTKAALNRIVAARVINPLTGKSKLFYCQRDGGSQLTIISNKLVEELTWNLMIRRLLKLKL